MSDHMNQSNTIDMEQDRWLDDATENVKKQAWFMKRALDNGDVYEALKYAASMTDELRTSKLSPKNYYELYMDVTNEIRDLELYFEEEVRNDSTGGTMIAELYEHVQHAGNIIPRLYLLCTVGSVYIKTQKAPAKDVLFDLVELCRGVQHPMRGLFLRNYLSQIAKDKVPDAGSEYEGNGGTVKDAIEFILQNFDNMTRLWVRMQHQGAVRDRSRREKERRNLRQLVGTNLVRLSEMDGVDLEMYKEMVLPRVLELIVNCKDTIAQEYLMEVIIQVIPDDFHLATLEVYLGTLSQLQSKVNVKNIIIALMNRLANYARESPQSIPTGLDMFPLFLKYSTQVIETNKKIPLKDVLQLQVALVNFASTVYPNEVHYIDHVLGFSVKTLENLKIKKLEKDCERHVVELLSLPLQSLGLQILHLNSYETLMSFLEYYTRKEVSMNIVEAIVASNELLDTPEKVDRFFNFVSPILKDQDDSDGVDDEFEFDQEQSKAAALFHLLYNDDTDVHFQLYAVARKHYGQGGLKRIQYTLPPLVFGCLDLVRRVNEREVLASNNDNDNDDNNNNEDGDENNTENTTTNKDKPSPPKVKSKKIFGFVHEIVTALTESYPNLALRLFLQASLSSDALDYEAITYEFLAQAFIVYEDEISDSKAQLVSISLIGSYLFHLQNFSEENYDILATKCTQHSAKLLKKPDQCRAVVACAHLFWPGTDEHPGHRDAKRVLGCLQRSLKIADGAINNKVFLFVDILNKYLYFFERGCPSIKVNFVKGLIALIDEHVPNMSEDSESRDAAVKHYQNTLQHIKLKQQLQNEIGERYREINEDGDGD